MVDIQHCEAHEEPSNSDGQILNNTSSMSPLKRACLREIESEEDKETCHFQLDASLPLSRNSADDGMMTTSALSTDVSISPWRLPSNQTLAHNQEYVNTQLQHVVAVSSIQAPRASRRLRMAQEKARLEDIDKVCIVDLTTVWEVLAVEAQTQTQEQERAEKTLRDTLDLINYLLYIRDQELEHQNQLSERVNNVEKQVARKNQIVHTLTSELETLKQNTAQRENMFQAKEQGLIRDRKMLQMEKKVLEVNCARLQGVETAYKAQLRRKDVDYARLKKSLQDAVTRAAKEKRGMAITKPLNGVHERKQALMNNQSKESKLTKQIMENLKKKRAELVFENEALAKDYDTLQQHLESLTSQYKKAVRLFLAQYVSCRQNLEGDAEELKKLASAPIDDFAPIPFNMATKANIPRLVSRSMEALDEKLKQFEHVICNELPSAEARCDKEIIRHLHQKLDDAHCIIKEQDQLLQASLFVPAVNARIGRGASRSGIVAAALVDRVADYRSSPNVCAEEDLAREKSELAALRHNLEKERELLQEQAIKLDKDRLEYEISKRDQIFGSNMDVSCKRPLRPISNTPNCITPKRQCQAKQFDVNGLASPIDIPVSATPETAAYLKEIGIHMPSEK